jgi:lysophospholipase L1-like esterase
VQQAEFAVVGPHSILVATSGGNQTWSGVIDVPPPSARFIQNEYHSSLPVFDSTVAGWTKGIRLEGVAAQEATIGGTLDADSVVVRIAASGEILTPDVDYVIDPYWGTIGALEGGRLTPSDAVFIDYQCYPPRIDSVVLQKDGQIVLRLGVPATVSPVSPGVGNGEKLLGRIYQKGMGTSLSAANLFPVLTVESARKDRKGAAALPDKMTDVFRKLRKGKELRILAWGDSVTDGYYLEGLSAPRWQDLFVAELKRTYPKANITLMTQAWPGHGTSDYLGAGPESPRHFESAVIGMKPDLVISEFVNDSYLTQAETSARYAQLLNTFRTAGIDWVIMTPSFTNPEFMGGGPEFTGGYDPRPYVAGLREFASANRLNLADASTLWSDLKRQGIPYIANLSNGINHPDGAGQRLFVEALMKIFAK